MASRIRIDVTELTRDQIKFTLSNADIRHARIAFEFPCSFDQTLLAIAQDSAWKLQWKLIDF